MTLASSTATPFAFKLNNTVESNPVTASTCFVSSMVSRSCGLNWRISMRLVSSPAIFADPDIGRLARGACDGVGRAFRRLDGHVEAELTKIAALQRVVESGRAAICRKIEHHADLRGALC